MCGEAEATGALQVGGAGSALLAHGRREHVEAELRAAQRRGGGGISVWRGLVCGRTESEGCVPELLSFMARLVADGALGSSLAFEEFIGFLFPTRQTKVSYYKGLKNN